MFDCMRIKMAFEEDTHQQHNEEVTQLQKQKENEQFQRELDEIIARLENEQFQKELDEIIERLDQESQEPPSTQEVLSSHESVSEENPEQLNILETSTQSSDNQLISRDGEEQTQNQDLTVTESSIQKEQETVKDQEVELNLLQMREDYIQFQ